MNLIFDLGGVLVTYDRPALLAEIFSDPAAHDRVHGALYADWVEVDRGTLALDDAITRAATRAGMSERDVAHIFRGMSHRWVGMPESIDLLYRLKDKGHRLFCLSNMGVDSIEYLDVTQTFWDAFDGIVVSRRVGLCKPEREIFAHVLERFGLNAAGVHRRRGRQRRGRRAPRHSHHPPRERRALRAGAARAGVPMSTFLYVGNTESNEIIVLRLDRPNGDLTPVEKVAIPGVTTPGGSTPMAVSPDKTLLYAGTRDEPKIAAAFAIDPAKGTLKHVASGPLADSMAYIALDRTGRYLLGASYPGNKVTVSRVDPPGTVQPAHQVLEGHPKAHSILADPANRHVLVPTLGNDQITVFRFDASAGTLTPIAPARVQDKAGPRHFRFHPNGRIVYLLGETDAAVYVFDYDPATAALKEKQRISAIPPGFQEKTAAADIHVTPDGKFLYASERRSSTLAGFRLDPASSTLTPVGNFPTETQPRGFAIESSSRYLFAVGQLSHAMSAYRIDPERGTLTKLREYPMGKNPNWIEIVDLP